MKTTKYLCILFSVLTFLCLSMVAHAQEAPIEMADSLRQSGKIYVVLVNALIILGVLSIFLIRLEIRLKRMEKEANSTNTGK